MALSKFIVASLLASLLVLHLVNAQEQAPQGSILQQIDCKAACGVRCHLSSHPNNCERACGSCCEECNCVPPGTSGNQGACPCYAGLTTRGGQPKCP